MAYSESNYVGSSQHIHRQTLVLTPHLTSDQHRQMARRHQPALRQSQGRGELPPRLRPEEVFRGKHVIPQAHGYIQLILTIGLV